MPESKYFKYFSLLLILCVTFCRAQEKNTMYNFEKDKARQVTLSSKLKEISGIAFSKDGKLFAHDDERAVIYQLDPANGKIIKSFYFGLLVKRADFEDIEIVNDDFYMISSDGLIYRFKEGADKERVDYETYSTDLKSANDVEGLCYDPATNSLLLALKGHPGAGLSKKKKAVYSFSLLSLELEKLPRFILDADEIKDLSKENDFAPSAIARHTETGNFFIVASSGNLIVELNAKGKIINVNRLDRKIHSQPEGIAFSDKLSLFISDEGKKYGTLTEYKAHKTKR